MRQETGTPVSSWTALWPDSDADSPPDDEFRVQCARVAGACQSLAGRCGALFSRSADEIAGVLGEVAALRATVVRLEGQQGASLASDPAGPLFRDAQLAVDDASDALDVLLRAIEREWRGLPAGKTGALVAQPELRPYRHYLDSALTLAPYTLGEEAERALASRDYPAGSAWTDLYYQVMGSLTPVVAGQPVSLAQARSDLEHGDAAVRERGLAAIFDAIEPVADVLAQCLDCLVADRLALNELRGLPYPRAERDLANDLPAAVVDDMLTVVEQHYPLAQRWFTRKASLLGTARLSLADMHAPAGPGARVAYPAAAEAVAEALAWFAPEAGQLVRRMVERGRVDAEPREGKQPGSFCWSLGPGQLPRITLTYLGTIDDVITLAHEFGHALHFVLAGRKQNGLTFDAPPALNEVAPAFTELLIIDWLIENAPDNANQRLLLAKRADAAVEAICGSAFLTRLETRAHEVRAAGTTLTSDRLRELWSECGAEFYGPGVDRPPRWDLHWALVPHLFHERFYSYIYTFARLVGLSLYAAYRRDPDLIRPRIIGLLSSGSSAEPIQQLAAAGIDLTDPGTWHRGMEHFAEILDPLW